MYKCSLTIKNVPVDDMLRCKTIILSNLATIGVACRNLVKPHKVGSTTDNYFSIFTYFYLNRKLTKKDIETFSCGLQEYIDSLIVLVIDNDKYAMLVGNEIDKLESDELKDLYCDLSGLRLHFIDNEAHLPHKQDKIFYRDQLNFIDGHMYIP